MPYYHDIITSQSWQELMRLKKLIPFVLIGGWATYLYTRALKSKDIDIAVDYPALAVIKDAYDVRKNDRLRKYEAVKGPVAIDIYLPHYSRLGIPVEEIMKRSRLIEGFSVVDSDLLVALKIVTLSERGRTAKGRKDFLDLIAFANAGLFNKDEVTRILTTHRQASALPSFHAFLHETTRVPELGITTHRYAKLKKSLLYGNTGWESRMYTAAGFPEVPAS